MTVPSPDHDPAATTDDLLARLAAQDAVIEALAARLATLESSVPPAAPSPSGGRSGHMGTDPHPDGGTGAQLVAVGVDEATDGDRPGRRELLRRAVGTTAGALAAGAALALVDADPAAAVTGTFTGDPAVTGTASPSTGTGVFGTAADGYGVYGQTTTGTGVFGAGSTGYGMYATSGSSFGLKAASGSSYGIATYSGTWAAMLAYSNKYSQVIFGGNPASPFTAGLVRYAGEMLFDTNQDLWMCVTTGGPAGFRKLAGPGTAGSLHLLPAPVRVYDSRAGNAPNNVTKGKLANATSRTIDCTNNASGVPAAATAALVNVTVVNTSAAGFLALYKAGIPYPGTSTINWDHTNQVSANTTVVALAGAAQAAAYVPANSSTDFLVDVIGYYQ